MQRNIAAVDTTLAHLFPVPIGTDRDQRRTGRRPTVANDVTDFVQRVTARILAGEGDLLPVSALPPDGTFPTGTVPRREAHDRHRDPDLGSRTCASTAASARSSARTPRSG